MSPRRGDAPLWSLKGDELLADGEWHDGAETVLAMEKAVPPGLAIRQAERSREIAHLRRTGEQQERTIARSDNLLKRSGARSIVQTMVTHRVKTGAWLSDPPWPLPPRAWVTRGAFRLMDRRVHLIAVTNVRKELSCSLKLLREIMAVPPAIQTVHRRGTATTYVHRSDLPELQRRLRDHFMTAARNSIRAGLEAPVTQSMYTLTDLGHRYHTSPEFLRRFMAAYPDLDWMQAGRITRLMSTTLPDFEKYLIEFIADGAERRSAAARGVAAAKQAKKNPTPTPTFADPGLAASVARTLGEGDASGRDQMYADMRRVFHDADVAAGDAGDGVVDGEGDEVYGDEDLYNEMDDDEGVEEVDP